MNKNNSYYNKYNMDRRNLTIKTTNIEYKIENMKLREKKKSNKKITKISLQI